MATARRAISCEYSISLVEIRSLLPKEGVTEAAAADNLLVAVSTAGAVGAGNAEAVLGVDDGVFGFDGVLLVILRGTRI